MELDPKRWTVLGVIMCVVVGLAWAGSRPAEDPGVLGVRVRALERQVDALERQVAQLRAELAQVRAERLLPEGERFKPGAPRMFRIEPQPFAIPGEPGFGRIPGQRREFNGLPYYISPIEE